MGLKSIDNLFLKPCGNIIVLTFPICMSKHFIINFFLNLKDKAGQKTFEDNNYGKKT